MDGARSTRPSRTRPGRGTVVTFRSSDPSRALHQPSRRFERRLECERLRLVDHLLPACELDGREQIAVSVAVAERGRRSPPPRAARPPARTTGRDRSRRDEPVEELRRGVGPELDRGRQQAAENRKRAEERDAAGLELLGDESPIPGVGCRARVGLGLVQVVHGGLRPAKGPEPAELVQKRLSGDAGQLPKQAALEVPVRVAETRPRSGKKEGCGRNAEPDAQTAPRHEHGGHQQLLERQRRARLERRRLEWRPLQGRGGDLPKHSAQAGSDPAPPPAPSASAAAAIDASSPSQRSRFSNQSRTFRLDGGPPLLEQVVRVHRPVSRARTREQSLTQELRAGDDLHQDGIGVGHVTSGTGQIGGPGGPGSSRAARICRLQSTPSKKARLPSVQETTGRSPESIAISGALESPAPTDSWG